MSDRPVPHLIRSPEDAEEAAASWLRSFGYQDARTTGEGADGGVDVLASGVVAQVKAEMKPTGRPVVQQIAGIASVDNVQAMVFSLAGYTTEAEEWALTADVALFRFDLQGSPTAVNVVAEAVSSDSNLLSKIDVVRQATEEFRDAGVAELESFRIIEHHWPNIEAIEQLCRAWLDSWVNARIAARRLLDAAIDCRSAGLPVSLNPLAGNVAMCLFYSGLRDAQLEVDSEQLGVLVGHRVELQSASGEFTLDLDDMSIEDAKFLRADLEGE